MSGDSVGDPVEDVPVVADDGVEADTPDAPEGTDAVRAALGRARAGAAARGRSPGPPSTRRRSPAPRPSGAGPDARDPQPVGSSIERLVADRGWAEPVAVGGVIGRWAAVVGADVAAHCVPESFEAGVLVVRADSSAWATQVRLLVPTLLRRMADEVGEGTVERVVVRGPSGPSWRRGPWVSPGSQGPRDTYG